jgi:hypothetical protein
MKDCKLIVLDMDGTLLGRSGSVSLENKEAVLRAKRASVQVALASGRHVKYVMPTARELDIDFPVVTNNGCETWSSDGQLLKRYTMPTEHILWLHQLALEHGTPFRAYATSADFENDAFPSGVNAEPYTWLMFMFRIKDSVTRERLWDILQQHQQFELSMASPAKLDVNPRTVSKGNAVAALCQARGIDPSQVMAIGDGINDISLLRWAGYGIAMGNAEPEVKSAADWITTDVEDHGVAVAIERMMSSLSG